MGIVATALHAKGRDILYCKDQTVIDQITPTSILQALEFLIEADHAFENCRVCGAEALVDQLDNYGLLQLDLCWSYVLLQNCDYLPDVERRLMMAEHVIIRNFSDGFLHLAE